MGRVASQTDADGNAAATAGTVTTPVLDWAGARSPSIPGTFPVFVAVGYLAVANRRLP
ncbi:MULTISPECIES: hypothetical protein [Protofrankia]|uniref:hypothetical protein n=1 Tax=Protofrankia sp. BMG5.30 TaxID=1834514 RepID=UPI001F1FDEEC|nr:MULTISPECIES: hypothetical protein [Protofrankia]